MPKWLKCFVTEANWNRVQVFSFFLSFSSSCIFVLFFPGGIKFNSYQKNWNRVQNGIWQNWSKLDLSGQPSFVLPQRHDKVLQSHSNESQSASWLVIRLGQAKIWSISSGAHLHVEPNLNYLALSFFSPDKLRFTPLAILLEIFIATGH